MALERNTLSPPLELKLTTYTAPIISAAKRISFTQDLDLPMRGIFVFEDVTEAVCCGRYEGTKVSPFLHAPGSAGPAKSKL